MEAVPLSTEKLNKTRKTPYQNFSCLYEGEVRSCEISATGMRIKLGNGVESHIPLDDIIGVSKALKQTGAFMVHTCPFKGKAKNLRERKTHWFICSDETTRDSCIITLRALLSGTFDWEDELVIPPRHFLVLIDSFVKEEGAGEVWVEVVKPMFEVAGIQMQVIEATRVGVAESIARQLVLGAWEMVVCVGGEDLLGEVINGFMSHNDWTKAIKTPIGLIPSLRASNLASFTSLDPVTAVFTALKGFPQCVDLFSVVGTSKSAFRNGRTPERKRTYGILSFCWGMFSEVDFVMDHWMGDFRFQWNALSALVGRKKKYTGRLSLATVSPWEREPCKPGCVICSKEDSTPMSPRKSFSSTTSLVDWREKAMKLKHDLNREIQQIRDWKEHMDEMEIVVDESQSKAGSRRSGPALQLWKEDDPLYADPSQNWVTLTGEFAFILVGNIATPIGESMTVPWAHRSDGRLDVVLVRKTTPANLAKVLSSLQNGSHVQNEAVEYFKVKGFRLEPTSEGCIRVDGAIFKPYGPVCVELHQGVARVVCRE